MSTGSVTGRDPLTGDGRRIAWEDGRIAAVTPVDDAPPLYVAAGLIDLQLNGFAGHDLNAETLAPATVSALARAVLATGTTSFLPTLVTAPEARISAALAAIAEARSADPLVARIVAGVHLEGPWIAPEDGPRGAHPRAHVTAPDLAALDRWQEASGGLVRIVTLSPHWPGSAEVVRGLVARGIRVAIGHTGASPEAVAEAAAAGATLSTHLGNGVAAQLPRHPNLLWQQLADDRLTASFIADGHHLSPETFRAMLRAKGRARAILVSDATALAGLPPGRYVQPIGGAVELSATGRLSLAGTPYLAGAALPLAAMVACAAAMAGIGLADALALASDAPAALIGRRARIEPGAPADLVVFGWTPGADRLAIERVILGGAEA